MGNITLEQAAQWCGGRVEEKYREVAFCGANIDSRKILPGQLFVALEGVRDGHEFIPMAMENGAAAVLCKHCQEDIPAIIVEDPRIALGKIAGGYRQQLDMKVVGVTGSVGKSTTKEMIAAVLQEDFVVSKTPANHNNDLGMPMAILAMPENTQIAVLEMGMNHFGEIAYLTGIAQPDVAVIVNIGTMHIEHLGSREGILQAKLEILEGLKPNGKAFFNGDDDMLWGARENLNCRVAYFGNNNFRFDLRARVLAGELGKLAFQVATEEEVFAVELPLEGEHYIPDALAAVSVGLHFGVAPQQIRKQLASFQNMEGRQEIFGAKGYTIIKDCYNAGPESMAAALQVLKHRAGRRIAVLGDMLELGARAAEEHEKVGALAASCADVLLSYGPNREYMVAGAVAAGMDREHIGSFDSRDAMADSLRENCREGDVLLFKGSHGMHMELVLEKFLNEER